MSLRKFMHPRNKYKTVPDFKQLAVSYPEFRKVAITDLTGKIKVNFKNEETLRILTEVLLKHDFNLDVKIPPNKLVPTLPLRLNYILWIEDLLNYASFNDMEEVIGIDIGTGAICIYPLLLAKMYGSHMIGTEVDETSVQTAVHVVKNNNLQHLIKVLKVENNTILKEAIKGDRVYHFVMCNPPFFEMNGASTSVEKRLPPRNAPTGNEGELTIQGGERTFVTQMIDESMEMKDKVKIYTTMFGRKSNLLFFLKLLKRKDIENATWTEFCQGHTKRWGLAWSFLSKDVLDLKNAPVIRKSGDYIAKLLRHQRPTEITFPMRDKFSSFDHVIDLLEESLKELNIQIKDLNLPADDFDGWACQLVAEKDTWSHARRKRRLAQRLMKLNEQSTENTSSTEISVEETSRNDLLKVDEIEKMETSTEKSGIVAPLLVCNFFVEVIEHEDNPENDNLKISMVLEKGNGGRNALETLRQYLINKLNIREYSQQQYSKSNKKKRKRFKKSPNTADKSSIDPGTIERDDFSIENSAESS